MLSILIPVYNTSVITLVNQLHKQALRDCTCFEIIVIDDCSTFHEVKIANEQLNHLPFIKYIQLNRNLGRSAIRNMLIKEAKYEYLLLMDCDALVPQEDFIKNYVKECNGTIVVCGGTAYQKEKPPSENILRWHYGVHREVKTADERNILPNHAFSTFNFLISRDIPNTIVFDETLVQYGHEDTMFGYMLLKHGYTVKHINNPLLHCGLDKNEDFIFKTKLGVQNLHYLAHQDRYKTVDFSQFKIMKVFKIIKLLLLKTLIAILYHLTINKIEKQLCSEKPNLYLFDFMKIGYLCTLKNIG
ncbi:MAG: glycosyltransferase family 2 protein [Bacteroidales bacterium]|nr:glycosyltransferase family 2 protein [Bacteroidales bacterium]